jgi:hypothetical protein
MRVESIAFLPQKLLCPSGGRRLVWFRTQALGQSNFSPFDSGWFFIFCVLIMLLEVLDLRFLMSP